MDLKGAKIVNFYQISGDVQSEGSDVNKVKIPHYQRPYSWDKNMVKKLIEDWHNQDETEYFAGSIVTVADRAKKTHDLIDGQQRFTTIFLTNYVLFLLLRVTTRQAIAQSKILHLSDLFEQLQESSKFLFVHPIENFDRGTLLEEFQGIEEMDGEEKEDGRSKFSTKYRSLVRLPDLMEDSADFQITHSEELAAFISTQQTLLSYDRQSFNHSFSKALSRVYITLNDQNKPRLRINESDLTSIERQYTDAIQQIFESFMELNKKEKPFEIAKSLVERMVSFLKEIKLCLVQTGNPKDAYTLFEVLNDRSMALADLDLIKNQFYKQYCLKNNESDSVIDSKIELLENQWGDRIYNDTADYRKKYITYFATTFLSGSTSVGYNQNDKYREVIKAYLDTQGKYTSNSIVVDFNIFQACKLIVNSFDLKDREREKFALKAEYNKDRSPAYKAVSLLCALKYNGVIAGYVCLLLKYIQKYITSSFSYEEVKQFLSELIDNSSKEKFSDLNQQAVKLSHLALLHKDYKGARDASNRLIVMNHKGSETISYSDITPLNDDNREVFYSWLDSWQYSPSEIKVRILFAKLLSTSLDPEGLTRKRINIGMSEEEVARLHLDHMEPKTFEESNSHSYFMDDSRDYHVNSIGNMFPLTQSENISKSNKPFVEAFSFISKSGLGEHWVTQETKKLFDDNNFNKVPKQEFFTKRKAMLKEKFYQSLKLE
ncbi:GmrSD restriction endonuclease domain-containing protein [Pseudoalteromonas sp. SSM20]|uniref:GmrSD restriction endonuclease domain-containing protein n=1 Tax=Pseudoalteromonas sp. SSM20 TaxID=3139394 RepID=UPI003BAADF80